MAMSEELAHRFKYHPPSSDGVRHRHEDLREACALFASMILELVPEGREQALTLTHIEQAMFWGNAGIARCPSNKVELVDDDEVNIDIDTPFGYGPR